MVVRAGRRKRVLGIDPGSLVMGFGIVERDGTRLVHVAHGFARFDRMASLTKRLGAIYEAIANAIATHAPESVAVEGLFTFRSPRSALTLAQARGAALACVANHHLAVHEYSPAEIKRAVGAHGAGAKDQVQRMVGMLLGLTNFERPDCADALAAAVCHLNRASFAERVLATGIVP
jgi:crossover junction endodeoxyribonuclease RuvC